MRARYVVAVHCLLGAVLLSAPRALAEGQVLYYWGALTMRGDPVTDTYPLRFSLYDSEVDGIELWHESMPVSVEAGVFGAVLGLRSGFPPGVFAGNPVYLGLSIGAEPLARQRVGAVPISLTAQTLGTLGPSDVTTRVQFDGHQANASAHHTRYTDAEAVSAVGACSACVGTGPLADGAVTRAKLARDGCQDGEALVYSVTAAGWTCVRIQGALYTAGPGLTLSSGAFSLPLTCNAGQVLRWTGTTWLCGDAGTGSGSVTSISATAGLSGGTITSTGSIGIAAGGVTADKLAPCQSTGQVLKWNGSEWLCAADENSGFIASVTGVAGLTSSTTAGAVSMSIAPGGVTPDKVAPCTAAGQVMRWTGSAWSCTADDNLGAYVQNQGSVDQPASMRIAGTGVFRGRVGIGTDVPLPGATPNSNAMLAVGGGIRVGEGRAMLASTGTDNFSLATSGDQPNPNFFLGIGDGDGGVRHAPIMWNQSLILNGSGQSWCPSCGDVDGGRADLVIDAVGRVGVNKRAPAEQLHVVGNVKIEGNLGVTGGINADKVDGFDTNSGATAVPNTIPVTDSSGKIRREVLPFSQGDVLAPADRPLVSGLPSYSSAYFDISQLGVSGTSASAVVAGVRFGPRQELVGTAPSVVTATFEDANGVRYSGPAENDQDGYTCCSGSTCSVQHVNGCIVAPDDSSATSWCRRSSGGDGPFHFGRCLAVRDGICGAGCWITGDSCGVTSFRSLGPCLFGPGVCTKIVCFRVM